MVFAFLVVFGIVYLGALLGMLFFWIRKTKKDNAIKAHEAMDTKSIRKRLETDADLKRKAERIQSNASIKGAFDKEHRSFLIRSMAVLIPFGCMIFFAVFVFAMMGLMGSQMPSEMMIPFLGILAVFGLIHLFGQIGWIRRALNVSGKGANNSYKENVIRPMLEVLFPSPFFSYYPNRGFQGNVLDFGGIFNGVGSWVGGEDFFSGAYDHVAFQAADATFGTLGTKGRKNSRTGLFVFDGSILILPLKQTVNGLVIAKADNLMDVSGLKEIATESIAFNKNYKAYGTTEQLAFETLTPAIIAGINELIQTHNLTFVFSKDLLFVYRNNQKLSLEPKLRSHLDEVTVRTIGQTAFVMDDIKALKSALKTVD